MKIPMKLNRSHLIVSVGSMMFVMVVLSLLGYLKFSEGYESPEALEKELIQLMAEMVNSPVIQEVVSPPIGETLTELEPEPEDEAGQMNALMPGTVAM
jgi:hypothetical protein